MVMEQPQVSEHIPTNRSNGPVMANQSLRNFRITHNIDSSYVQEIDNR